MKSKKTGIGHSNLPVVTKKYDPQYKKCRFELLDEIITIRNELLDSLYVII